jgi:hypothetical protein
MAKKKDDECSCHTESNACGITGIVISFFFPLIGLILGIVALARGEKTKSLGIIAITFSAIMVFARIVFMLAFWTLLKGIFFWI